jgi:uncharacterized membrane protein (DUF2068 family)
LAGSVTRLENRFGEFGVDMDNSQSGLIRLIAVFKLFKAATLIAVGISALKLFHQGGEGTVEHWVRELGLNPGGRYVDMALGRIANVPPERLKDVGFGSFVYAALFLTEGAGLWLRKRWAEWFTVIITGSLIPLEIYEIHRHPTAGKVLVLAINIAVVVYLLIRIRREQGQGG